MPTRRITTTGPSRSPSAPLWLGDPGVDVAAARTRRHEARAAWLRWEQATTVGDYKRVGTKDPRWDADARACLEAYARALTLSPEAGKPDIAIAKAAGERALTSGCTDPLVRYAALRLWVIRVAGSASVETQRYAQAEADIEKSDYSAVRKCYASFRAATTAAEAARFKVPAGSGMPLSTVPNPGTVSYKAASLDRTFRHLIEVLRDPSIPPREFYKLADSLSVSPRTTIWAKRKSSLPWRRRLPPVR